MNKLISQSILRKDALKQLQTTHSMLMERQLELTTHALEMENLLVALQKPLSKTTLMLNLKSNSHNFLILEDNIGSLDWANNTNIQLLVVLTIDTYGFCPEHNICQKIFITRSLVT
jgi:hypothetical protein